MDAKPVIIAAGVVLAWTAVRCWRDASGPRRWTRRPLLGAVRLALPCWATPPSWCWTRVDGAPPDGRARAGTGLCWRAWAGARPPRLNGLASAPAGRPRPRLGHRLFWPRWSVGLHRAAGLVGAAPQLGRPALVRAKRLTLPPWRWRSGALLVAWRITGSSGPDPTGPCGACWRPSAGPCCCLMLAMLGGVFMASHRPRPSQQLVAPAGVDPQQVMGLVVLYTAGMAAFTMVMGNARGFPGAVCRRRAAVPHPWPGRAAVPVLSIGMLCGYCGTLMTRWPPASTSCRPPCWNCRTASWWSRPGAHGRGAVGGPDAVALRAGALRPWHGGARRGDVALDSGGIGAHPRSGRLGSACRPVLPPPATHQSLDQPALAPSSAQPGWPSPRQACHAASAHPRGTRTPQPDEVGGREPMTSSQSSVEVPVADLVMSAGWASGLEHRDLDAKLSRQPACFPWRLAGTRH